MQLEVGKKYITRNPEACDYATVINFIKEPFYPFKVKLYGGLCNEFIGSYTSDGSFLSHEDSDYDLIAEYKENIEFDLKETQRQLEKLCNWK